jgi:hypothetical protein
LDSEKPGKTQTGSQEAEKPSELLDTISFATFDLDARIFRTIWDSVLRTPDVAMAGAQSDYTRYLSPVRVFIALFSFQFVVAALFGTPLTGSLEQMTVNVEPAAVDAWMAQARDSQGNVPTYQEVNNKLESLNSLLLWPVTILSSLPYLLLLKLYRLNVPVWAHLQFYLVPTNASFILMIAGIPLLLLDNLAIFMAGVGFSMVVFFICIGRVILRYYSRTALGGVMRILGMLGLFPIVFLISSIGQFLSIYWILESQFGLDLFELMVAAAEAASSQA